jgi:hypothetical protein
MLQVKARKKRAIREGKSRTRSQHPRVSLTDMDSCLCQLSPFFYESASSFVAVLWCLVS